jgi:hypothetical protein
MAAERWHRQLPLLALAITHFGLTPACLRIHCVTSSVGATTRSELTTTEVEAVHGDHKSVLKFKTSAPNEYLL